MWLESAPKYEFTKARKAARKPTMDLWCVLVSTKVNVTKHGRQQQQMTTKTKTKQKTECTALSLMRNAM